LILLLLLLLLFIIIITIVVVIVILYYTKISSSKFNVTDIYYQYTSLVRINILTI